MNPVQTVCDGLEATRYLAGEGKYEQRHLYPLPGIVILDLLLPKMDGFEVLSWIRARRQFNNLPVIVLTGHANDPNMECAKICGADGFLAKGADTDALIHLLKNAFLGWALVPTRTARDSRPAASVMR